MYAHISHTLHFQINFKLLNDFYAGNVGGHLRLLPCDGDDHLHALDLLLPLVRSHVLLGAVVRVHPGHALVVEAVLQSLDLVQVGVGQGVTFVVESMECIAGLFVTKYAE